MLLFTLLRSKRLRFLIAPLLGWIFAHMGFALPVRRLRETPHWLAFYHPAPAYPVHILLTPKRAVAGLDALTTQDAARLAELFECVAGLVEELHLEERGYRLIVNGGKYQDVPLLHFHLVSGDTGS